MYTHITNPLNVNFEPDRPIGPHYYHMNIAATYLDICTQCGLPRQSGVHMTSIPSKLLK